MKVKVTKRAWLNPKAAWYYNTAEGWVNLKELLLDADRPY